MIRFDTTAIPGLTYSDQFISLTTRTASTNLYGFGEQTHPSLKQNMSWIKWGMFARDEGPVGVNYITNQCYTVYAYNNCCPCCTSSLLIICTEFTRFTYVSKMEAVLTEFSLQTFMHKVTFGMILNFEQRCNCDKY